MSDAQEEAAALLASAGLTFPDDRLPVLATCLGEVKAWRAMLSAWDLQPAHEPSNTYDPRTILRAIAATE